MLSLFGLGWSSLSYRRWARATGCVTSTVL